MAIIFNKIKEKIIESLDSANTEIFLMLAWFTEEEIFSSLENAIKNRNVSVKLILSNSEWNLILYDKFKEISKNENFEIKVYGSSSPDVNPFLHMKTAIIDNNILLNGSYNWTKNAKKNVEAYTVSKENVEIQDCRKEFFKLWNTAVRFNFTDNLEESNIQELIELQNSGVQPETYHEKKEAVAKNPILDIIIPSKTVSPIILKSIQDLIRARDNQEFIYEKDLPLWGLELKRYSKNTDIVDIKIKLDSRIISFEMSKYDFVDLLKLDRNLFLLWDVLGEKYPMFFLNKYAQNITLVQPLYFKFKNGQLNLITEMNGFNCVSLKLGYPLVQAIKKFTDGTTSEFLYRRKFENSHWI